MSQISDAVEIFTYNKIITPMDCALIVNEIFKVLLYQKSQIPYPYTWLKTVVNKKRNNPDADNLKENASFCLDKHFQVVSKVYDTVEKLMKSLRKEFQYYRNCIKEVLIIFGATPHCPKEVYRINLNVILKDHHEESHNDEPNKLQQKILRDILLSQSWMDATQNSIPHTNTYVFIKKSVPSDMLFSVEDSVFVSSPPFTMLPRVKQFQINLNVAFCDSNSCGNTTVLEERTSVGSSHRNERTLTNQETNLNFVWSQSKDLVKGFKDRYVNNVSVCELW